MTRRPQYCQGRHAGVLAPLFACASTKSWGIGEIGDIAPMAQWLQSAALDVWLMLPVNEMASGQSSPYSALSAMAIDPIYISVGAVPEFQAMGGERALTPDERQRLRRVRGAPRIAYADVRALKDAVLRRVFDHVHRVSGGERREAFQAFVERERWWLDDYALFRALHERHDGQPWWEWDAALQAREPEALDRVRRELADDIAYYAFLQWLADAQWQDARRDAGGVGLFGDLPFMVGADSADVWAHADLFARDLSVGTPPDAFSATGQDWGLPAYRWDRLQATDFSWLHQRGRRAASLFDGFRVDHVIGFFRTYVRAVDGHAFFTPEHEHDQIRLGEHVLRIFQETGACVVAEDLGTVPDYLRDALARLAIPGYCVLRWERQWHDEGHPFRSPSAYPVVSLATTGTHDTEPLAVWWDGADEHERRLVLRALNELSELGEQGHGIDPQTPFGPDVRDRLLRALFASASNLLVLPVQDLFGWPDRINVPATTGEENWTYRLPWPVDRWGRRDEARERAQTLQAWAAETDRAIVRQEA